MTKGIREFTNTTFNSTLPQLAELGAVAFRREVMTLTMMAFEGVSVASAATHYNHALKQARIDTPDLVSGLGRAEDKKGGRKPIHTVDVIKVKTGEVVAAGVSRAHADKLVVAASAKGKTKLAIKEVAAAIVADAIAGSVVIEAVTTTEVAVADATATQEAVAA